LGRALVVGGARNDERLVLVAPDEVKIMRREQLPNFVGSRAALQQVPRHRDVVQRAFFGECRHDGAERREITVDVGE
jgi:hypothetical protein